MEQTEIKIPEDLKLSILNKFTPNQTYTSVEIKTLIHATDFTVLKPIHKPTTIKAGDVVNLYNGKKKRPCLILKVLKNRDCIYITLTASENSYNLISFQNRFFGDGYIGKTLSICSEEIAIENFAGVFDDSKVVKLAIKSIKDYYNLNLK